MKRSYIIFLILAGVVLAGCGGAQTHYSRIMINDRMSGWYNKDACVGFPNANSTNGVVQHFDELREMLQLLADGLVARQDKETGCWYQLLQYGPEKCATQGIDETGSEKYTNVSEGGTQCNYLESSASCLITAALLKGSRLGLIDHAEAGKRGYEGILRQFVKEENGMLTITGSCQSAGLSKDRWGNAAYYLIGKDVPIQDNTEGKVLGAFLMAAAEYERL